MGGEPPRRSVGRAEQSSEADPGGPRPPAAVHPVVAVQMAIGNAATARLMRQPAPGGGGRHPLAPPPHPLAEPPGLLTVNEDDRPLVLADTPPPMPADTAAKLLAVRATLSKVPPLAEKDAATLRTAIPGAPILELIERRDNRRGWLENYPSMVTSISPPAGQPDESVAYQLHSLHQTAEAYRAELPEIQARIDAHVQRAGVGSETELATLVGETFPRMFVERAKLIALRQLDDNLRIAEEEGARYGVAANPGGMYGGATFGGTPDYMAGPSDPLDVRSLRDAAWELLALQAKREEAQVKAGRLMRMEDEYDAAQKGDPDPGGRMGLPIAIEAEAAGRARLGLRHPILFQADPAVIANATDEQLTDHVLGKVQSLRRDILATQENIRDDDLEIWNLRGIVDLTRLDLGVADDSPLVGAIDAHIAAAKADDGILSTALTALQITAGVIAAVASGGLALVAGGVALGVGAYQVSEAVEDYMVESAAENVALDPTIADISVNEPAILPIVVGVLGMALDGAAVGKAIIALRAPARALVAGGDLGAFSVAAHKALPAAEADRLIERAALLPEVVARGAVGRGAVAGHHWTQEEIQTLFVRAFKRPGPPADNIVVHQSQAAFDQVRISAGMPENTFGFYIPAAADQAAGDALHAMGVLHLPPRATTLTVIHESLHMIGDASGVPALLGRYVDEGLTELLAREAFGPEAGRFIYEGNMAFVKILRDVVGRDALEEAFLHRIWQPLRSALEARLGGSAPVSHMYALLRQVGPDGQNGRLLDEVIGMLHPGSATP